MSAKKDMSEILAARKQPPPNLKRGQGMQLSTELPADTQPRESADMQDRGTATPQEHENATLRTLEIAETQNSEIANSQVSEPADLQELETATSQLRETAASQIQTPAKPQKRKPAVSQSSKIAKSQESESANAQNRINRGVTLPEQVFEDYKLYGVLLKSSMSSLIEEAVLAYLPVLEKRLAERLQKR